MKKNIKTEIIKIKGGWDDVVNDCRFTVGKKYLDKMPSDEFKKAILISEHSPIRSFIVKWVWRAMPHWVTVHWVRHKWECFVRTQRSDRTGIPRDKLPQDEPQDFCGEANSQHLIDTWRKRLCYMASKQTRDYAEDFKIALAIRGEEELSNVLVPNCIYRCGCPEMCSECKRFERMVAKDPRIASTNIQERYDAFNKIFWEEADYDVQLLKKITDHFSK